MKKGHLDYGCHISLPNSNSEMDKYRLLLSTDAALTKNQFEWTHSQTLSLNYKIRKIKQNSITSPFVTLMPK
jgi:hypothetical protein